LKSQIDIGNVTNVIIIIVDFQPSIIVVNLQHADSKIAFIASLSSVIFKNRADRSFFVTAE
jgi:hypothetical protein